MKKEFRFGLKLWSTNLNYIEEAKKLYKKSIYHYIELYVIPDSYKEYINYWKSLEIPFVIHAPHFIDGLNLSDKNKKDSNLKLAEGAIKFADELKSVIIIFHPGVNGDIDETIKQLNLISDKRIVIENKPYYGLNKIGICIGNSFDEIKYIIENSKVGFCLDIGHAICAANVLKIDRFDFIKDFIKLNPKIYHLTDGDYNGVYDEHLNLGKGNYMINKIIELIPEYSLITFETMKSNIKKLNDFVGDVNYFLKKIKDFL